MGGGEWADSGDTAQGKRIHARVDEGGGQPPELDELGEDMRQARSVALSSERLGVIAKMDVGETSDGTATARAPHSGAPPAPASLKPVGLFLFFCKSPLGSAEPPVRPWRQPRNWRTIAATKGDTRL